MDLYIKGNLKKIIFSGDNGYTVGLFKIKDGSEEFQELTNSIITFTGYFHELNENDTYILYGNFSLHNKYGEQFVVSSYERVKPEEKDSIVEFLSSGLFKGIGEKKALKIVEVLGNKTLEIILNNPDNLLLIPTITKRQVDILHNTLVEYESSYNTILRLSSLGFNTKDSMLIYNKYKQKTDDIIDNNLYTLYKDIKDISFKNIDKIALDNNYSKDDIRRVVATVFYALTEITNLSGNTYFFIEEIFNYTLRALGINISNEVFIDALNKLILDKDIIKQDEKYYLSNIYEDEEYIAKRIKYLTNLDDNKIKNLDKLINNMELLNNINYDDSQKDAVKRALEKNFIVITGGPGTGKTTIVKSIVNLYRDINKISSTELEDEIALLAPTGRASKRLAEATIFPATTIHRFLKWNKDMDKFSINEYNKSSVKLVIIDEASMIDISLMSNLLKGLKTDTKIILVGDYNQLPSVGPGQMLKDIIDSECVNVVFLNKLYRQSKNSNIITLAHNMKDGILDNNLFNKKEDLEFIATTDISNEIEKICMEYADSDYRDFQILAPMYKTIDGIDKINFVAQNIFNPKSSKKNELKIGEVTYRENDKILQLTNMPEENIFNGDIGIIKEIDKKQITIDFYGNLVKFNPSEYKNFKHGYAISIHKSQGSEFKTVVIPISFSYSKMLYRKLYYTAVTRSKNKLILVGNKDAFEKAVNTNMYNERRTTLKEKLQKKIKIMNNI